jgi:hypothetical protein
MSWLGKRIMWMAVAAYVFGFGVGLFTARLAWGQFTVTLAPATTGCSTATWGYVAPPAVSFPSGAGTITATGTFTYAPLAVTLPQYAALSPLPPGACVPDRIFHNGYEQ